MHLTATHYTATHYTLTHHTATHCTATHYTPTQYTATHCTLDFTTHTLLGKEYKFLSSSLCNFLHSSVTSSLLVPNTLLNTLFSTTLIRRSFHNISGQVSHPYRTTEKIIFLYTLICKFLTVTWMTNNSAPNNNKHSPTLPAFNFFLQVDRISIV